MARESFMPDVLFIEPCNFLDFPVGGQLSFARQMIRAFGGRLALVGISTDETPVGQWMKRTFDGAVCDFLSVGRWYASARKPLLPRRARAYWDIVRHRRQILSAGIRSVLISAPEALLASYRWGWSDLCFLFAGISSPLRMSRYHWAQPLVSVVDACLLAALRSAHLLLAAADEPAIREFAARTRGQIAPESIISFPTRVDTDIFYPAGQSTAREALGMPREAPVFAAVGRLNWVKGWDFLLEAFRLFVDERAAAHLYFVGDGEDRPALERKRAAYGLAERVHITGYLDPPGVAAHLNAADVFLLGSYFEGWPTVMVEALAVGKPIVATAVSAATTLIEDGVNGYIVGARDARLFRDAMVKALMLDACACSLRKSRRYALAGLAEDLGRLWAPLRS
jgi:glycosyltransferase involved in cell wall biosynthesis